MEHSKGWATRCMHEAQMNRAAGNCFLTLTYNGENLPKDGSLQVSHMQAFMKRLREKIHPHTVRFFGCGEYGAGKRRPHYHLLLFGYRFPDAYASRQRGKIKDFRSPTLERIWKRGFSTIGECNWQSAAYVARYIQKKHKGPDSWKHYRNVDTSTGEIYSDLTPEFIRMSLKPGIGLSWIETYWRDVYPHDFVVVEGKKFKPPRYYDKWLAENKPGIWESVYNARVAKALDPKNQANNHSKRLKAREEFANAKYSKLIRPIEEKNDESWNIHSI